MEKKVAGLIKDIIGNGAPCSKQDWITIKTALDNSTEDTITELAQKFIDDTPNLGKQGQLAIVFFVAYVKRQHL